jgi:hypothetical protein
MNYIPKLGRKIDLGHGDLCEFNHFCQMITLSLIKLRGRLPMYWLFLSLHCKGQFEMNVL